MGHFVFLLVLQIAGYALVIYSCGWLPAIGLFLLFWQNNVSQSLETKLISKINAVKYGRG